METVIMIVIDLKLDNFKAFRNFHLYMSYPKKVVHSTIVDECLKGRTNFRYKKLNILMGGNATGKTSLGRVMADIFAFISRKEYLALVNDISDQSRPAFFSIDFVPDGKLELYQLKTVFDASANGQYANEMIHAYLKKANIDNGDSYEKCIERINSVNEIEKLWNVVLEKIPPISWYLASTSNNPFVHIRNNADDDYLKVFSTVLQSIDPSIEKVSRIDGTSDSYMIHLKDIDVIIQQGQILKEDLLSSGTRAGIDIADMMSWLLKDLSRFFYCDEKFAYVSSDIEKAFLAVMVECLPENGQIFFTTHNLDILDMQYPKHSFCFLKKNVNDEKMPISCVWASDYLKRNTDSVRSAVENDLFSVSPSVDLVYKLADLEKRSV